MRQKYLAALRASKSFGSRRSESGGYREQGLPLTRWRVTIKLEEE
jgi:hypothetical protein